VCGIAGIVGPGAVDAGALARMTAALAHRGPDGADVWHDGDVAFGHRRLAIFDLSARGAQPMHYADRYVIVFNGSIYNHPELRAELQGRGYAFRSETDTEVILAAYDCWGPACLDRFNGMWAFVVHDRARRSLFMSRDRFGVKPLHWTHAAGSFLFASETKALLEHPRVSATPDADHCREYLAHGPREHLPGTAWAGVRRLGAGCFVEAAVDDVAAGRFAERRFWRLEPDTSTEPFDERRAERYAREYRSLLECAVTLRLRSDVKVGSALSGGLDSSAIVLLVNESLRARGAAADRQQTFSCVYRSPGTTDCDESGHIDAMARLLGVASSRIEPDVARVPFEHRRMIYHLDTPPEGTLMSSWHTFLCVGRSDVTVTLDGQGADEQLAGYPRYLVPYLAHARRPLAQSLRLASMPGCAALAGLGLAGAASRALGVPHAVPRLLAGAGKRLWTGDTLNEALAHDAGTGLANLLHYADRTSMAFSIESRTPYLDVRLASFLARLPAAYKIHDGWTKYLARRAMDGALPDSVAWRRDKLGWPIPEAFWIRGPLREWLCREIETSGFLRELGADTDARAMLGRRRTPVSAMIRLLNLATWHRVHVERAWRPEGLPNERRRARGERSARERGTIG
jgi:asparagine synthase (glutamine-hydrolysing)